MQPGAGNLIGGEAAAEILKHLQTDGEVGDVIIRLGIGQKLPAARIRVVGKVAVRTVMRGVIPQRPGVDRLQIILNVLLFPVHLKGLAEDTAADAAEDAAKHMILQRGGL